MTGKTTSSKATSAASKTLRIRETSSTNKFSGGSALLQRELHNIKNTLSGAATGASKMQSDGCSDKARNSATGSALSKM